MRPVAFCMVTTGLPSTVKCRSKRRVCAPAEVASASPIRIAPLTRKHIAEPTPPFIGPPRHCDRLPPRARRLFVDKPHTDNREPSRYRAAHAPIFHSRRSDYPRYPGFHATNSPAPDYPRVANQILVSSRRQAFSQGLPRSISAVRPKGSSAWGGQPRTLAHSSEKPLTSLP